MVLCVEVEAELRRPGLTHLHIALYGGSGGAGLGVRKQELCYSVFGVKVCIWKVSLRGASYGPARVGMGVHQRSAVSVCACVWCKLTPSLLLDFPAPLG